MAITDAFNGTNTQTCNYTHDDLARVASGNCGSVWSQTFTYDAFGNITKAGSNSFNPGYNPITNRMSSGATYDSNGDVLTDSLHSYAWDVETRPTTIDTVTATYDALGRMVEQTKSGASTEIQYAPTGFKMQTLNGQTVKNAFIPLPGGTVLVPQCECYFHGDWLGGSRFASRYSDRTMYNDLAYAPFGEQYATSGGTGVGNATFAGNRNDTTTNLYDAQFREYEPYGRWPSPDPAGVAAANPANPQSWNRYAYVMNNPLRLTDPRGLWCVWQDGTHDPDPEEGGDDQGQCEQHGGMWDPGDESTGCDQSWNCTFVGGFTVAGVCSPDDFSCALTPQQDQLIQQINQLWQQTQQMQQQMQQQIQQQIQQLQRQIQQLTPPPLGWCTAMENGGTTAMVGGGALFLAGTGEDLTVVGLPAGLVTQTSGGILGTLGTITAGVGFLGKAIHVCH